MNWALGRRNLGGDQNLERTTYRPPGSFSPRPGGVSEQCAILADHLAATGADISRLNTDIPGLRRRGRLGQLLLPFAQVASIVWQLWRLRRRRPILHVHAASWWGFMPAVAGLLARRYAKRLLVTYHGGEAAAFMARWGWLARPVLKRYDGLLTLTPTQARLFQAHSLPSTIVPNLVPIANYPFHQRGPVAPRLLWLRQLEPRYRPADALAVLAMIQNRYPEATLTLAGDGSLAATLKEIVDRQEMTGVNFLGHLRGTAVTKAYAHADIFLNTSAIDNLPLTLIEASASGLPIVSTDAGAIPDLIRDGENGLLAPVGDVQALARQVERLLADPELAARLSLAGRAHAEQFGWSQIGPKLAVAYGLGQAL